MLLIAISIGNYTFGQISFKKDYNSIDSLTKNLNSYNILVMINDSNISFPNAITEEFIMTFDFLKHKKRTALNPDFTIQVLINTILLILEIPQTVFSLLETSLWISVPVSSAAKVFLIHTGIFLFITG